MTAMEQSSSGLAFNSEKGPDARDRILSAALSLFAMRGFEGVSTTQIAKVAGITQPLIHYHFKNKEALWKATVSRLFQSLDKEFSQVVAKLPKQDKKRYIVEAIRNYVSFCAKHPEFGQFLMREGAQQTERMEWLANEMIKPVMQSFYDVYLEGVADEWVKPIPFPQLIMLISAASTHFFSLAPMVKTLFDIDPLSGEEALSHSDTVVEVIISSIFKDSEQSESASTTVEAGATNL
ncbi:MAG: TetR/AcrR family transcriptional regulator [Pseudomonadales bacterium]|nr:TetR/AcrR family transcriptional regulator [Pseudomonadales bacterium]